MSKEKEDDEQEVKPGAEVVATVVVTGVEMVAEVVEGRRGRFWEWPVGTKFGRKDAKAPRGEVAFYEYSYEHRDGNIHRAFLKVSRPEEVDVELKICTCSVTSTDFERFVREYLKLHMSATLVPLTADGFDVKVGEVYRYDFIGRKEVESCAFVRVLSYAYGTVVCVQTVDYAGKELSERCMVVHSSRLRKMNY